MSYCEIYYWIFFLPFVYLTSSSQDDICHHPLYIFNTLPLKQTSNYHLTFPSSLPVTISKSTFLQLTISMASLAPGHNLASPPTICQNSLCCIFNPKGIFLDFEKYLISQHLFNTAPNLLFQSPPLLQFFPWFLLLTLDSVTSLVLFPHALFRFILFYPVLNVI